VAPDAACTSGSILGHVLEDDGYGRRMVWALDEGRLPANALMQALPAGFLVR